MLALAAGLAACFLVSRTAEAAVQVLPAWQRLTPSAAAGANYTDIYLAKGEVESFQTGVWGSKGSYTVRWSAPSGLTVKAYSEAWVYVSKSSTYATQVNRPLPAGWYPDGLRPLANGGSISLDGGKPGIVWFDVKSSRTIASGVYTVSVTVGASSCSIKAHVWNFALPEKPALKSAIGLWTTRGKLAAETLLLEHRLMPTFIDYTHSSSLSAAGQTQAHAGGYATVSGTTVTSPKLTSSQVDAMVSKYRPLAPYGYIFDEKYDSGLLSRLNSYSSAMVGKVKRMGTTSITSASAWLDITTCLPKFLTQPLIDSRVNVGKEVWLYQTLNQDGYTPKWLTTYPYPNWALMSGFLPWRYRITGMLYWKADYWKSGVDPWTSADGYGTSYPGEACWILPLPDGTYAPTIRLKWLRDGVDTYDYLRMLDARGLHDWAKSVALTVAPDFRNWSRDPAGIEAARRQLGAKLSGSASATAAVTEGSLIPADRSVTVWAEASPNKVASGGSVRLSAAVSDTGREAAAQWLWSDGGAGGRFLPSATVSSPVYVAPANASGADKVLGITVTASCGGRPAASVTGLAPLTVLCQRRATTGIATH